MSAPRRPAGGLLDGELRRWPTVVLEEVARAIRVEVERALNETALRWDDVIVLTVLSAFRSLSQPALRDRTGLDRTTLGAVLADLEDEALVTRHRDLGDRRQMTVVATPLGRERASEARALVGAAERAAFKPLKPAEQRRLHVLLARLLGPEPHPLAGLFR